MATSLTDVLATLRKVQSGEGVVPMTAEKLTAYAEEQLTKASNDEDGGKARTEALQKAVTAALEVYKEDRAAEAEVVVFEEPKAPSEVDKLAETLSAKIEDLVTKLSKAEDNEAGNPTVDEVHPPPVPEPQEGGNLATDGEPEDDGTPRDQLVKSEGSTPDSESNSDDNVEKADEDQSEDDEFVWPDDLNTKAFREGTVKNCDETRPAWGFDTDNP